jgi:hypothetical protein
MAKKVYSAIFRINNTHNWKANISKTTFDEFLKAKKIDFVKVVTWQ